jgi:hypothetical protein
MEESFLKPCKVNIVIVADGDSLSFLEKAPFSLKLLVEHLREAKNPFVSFDVKTAHRTSESSTLDYKKYEFHDLLEFDEAWLFGQAAISDSSDDSLSEDSLGTIITFMRRKKGIFAAGDHQDLGSVMNARVPRVRSMRKWFFSEIILGEINAPSRAKADRHDTLRKGHNDIYESNDEKDDIPQEIEPVFYHTPCSPAYGIKTYPHPLLYGPRGVIKFLPDHMHEGECIIPDDLDETIESTGESEYPPLANSNSRVSPQIIAWSNIVESHTTQEGQETHPPVELGKFGGICVYDGHLVDVGRVAVESSFHHFLFGNLQGFEISHREEAQLAYEDIKSYYQNLGIWLAPPEKQDLMFYHSLWLTRWSPRVLAGLTPLLTTGSTIDVEKILDIGVVARRVHSRLTSICFTLAWVVSLIDKVFPQKSLSYFLNPWLELDPPLTSNSSPKRNYMLDTELLVDAVLGGVILEIAKQFSSEDEVASEDPKVINEQMGNAVKKGLLLGLKALPRLYDKLLETATES